MKHTTVYAGDRFELKGADPDHETTLAERSYWMETDFGVRFHLLLSYNSCLTFLCSACDHTYVPTWWTNRHLVAGATVLYSHRPHRALCVSCETEYNLDFTLEGAARHKAFPTSYHGQFMWSNDFKTFMTKALAHHKGINMFETILILDEMCDAIFSIKGHLESERIRREVPHINTR